MRMRNLLNSRRLRTDTAIFPPQAKDKDNKKEKFKYKDIDKIQDKKGEPVEQKGG